MSGLLEWRFVVTEPGPAIGPKDIHGTGGILTFLDRLARNREILYTLDAGAVFKCEVPSDNPEVNRENSGTDSDPFVSYNNRLVYGFRREAQGFGSTTWVCRFGGKIMDIEDEAQSNQATSHITAYDPWQQLMARPLTHGLSEDYKLVENQITYKESTGKDIAVALLKHTVEAHGTVHIDYGQSGAYAGTLEITDTLHEMQFTQGISVGEAWTQLCDTGTMDIVLEPIYDPINRPGYLAELNIYKSAGKPRYAAIFAWDMPSRSLVGVNHLFEGTQMATEVLYYKSSGIAVPLQSAPTSFVQKYGEWWLQKSVTDQAGTHTVRLLALAEMWLRVRGKETLTIDPTPERSPIPFLEYGLGDLVPVYASKRLRQPIVSDATTPEQYPGLWRVYAIPLTIRDDGIETVQKLLLTTPDKAIL